MRHARSIAAAVGMATVIGAAWAVPGGGSAGPALTAESTVGGQPAPMAAVESHGDDAGPNHSIEASGGPGHFEIAAGDGSDPAFPDATPDSGGSGHNAIGDAAASSPSSESGGRGTGEMSSTAGPRRAGRSVTADELRVSGSTGRSLLAEMVLDAPVPADLRWALPTQHHQVGDHGSPGSYAASDGCASQCITRGSAKARGFGAFLELQSHTAAHWSATVSGPGGFHDSLTQPGATTTFQWALDHLEPGTTYSAVVAATDGAGNTSVAWGSFTTLSRRDIEITLGTVAIPDWPAKASSIHQFVRLDSSLVNLTFGQAGVPYFGDVPRHVDLEVWILLTWKGDLCQAFAIDDQTPSYGHSDASCLVWSSDGVDDLDLDQLPAGLDHWTSTTVETTLSSDPGGALPSGYGGLSFSFSAPVTIEVEYS
jgi:hypothetical protein